MQSTLVPAVAASVLTLAFLAVGTLLSLGPVDDAYITFRCAENLADGHGLVYNHGEPVEATTNFLFAVILAGLNRIGIPTDTGALLVNGVALWWLIFILLSMTPTSKQTRVRRWRIISITALAFCPSMLLYLWVGLETVFYTSMLTSAVVLASNQNQTTSRMLSAGVFLALASLIRLEALIFVPVFLIKIFLFEPRPGVKTNLLAFSIPLAALFIPVLAIRWGYYGYPLPNTYYAKVDGGGTALAGRGLEYLFSFIAMYILAPITVLAGVARALVTSSYRPRAMLLISFILVQSAYVIFVGGDYFPYARFMVPILPCLAILLADAGTFRLEKEGPFATPIYYGALVIAVLSGISATSRPGHFNFAVTQRMAATGRAEIGSIFRVNVPKEAVLLVGAAGATPYFARHKSYDTYGLTDPVLAHRSMKIGVGFAGHEKHDTAEQVKRLSPDVIVFVEWPVRGVGQGKRRAMVSGAARAFGFLQERSSVLAEYRLMTVRSESHLAICGVREEMIPRLGKSFEEIEPVVFAYK